MTAEAASIRNEDQFDLLLATTDIGLWELDLTTRQSVRNLRHDQIFGYDAILPSWGMDDFLGHVVSDERDRVQDLLNAAITAGQNWSFETKITRVDGSFAWISARGFPRFSDSGDMVKMVGHVIDISTTKQNEERLSRLSDEINHRVKNTLAVVQSIARLTFVGEKERFEAFSGRMAALTGTHDVLLDTGWSRAKLRTIVEKAVQLGRADAIHIDQNSPDVNLNSRVAASYAMALHELCTNAFKYGALSVANGTIYLVWSLTDDTKELIVTWKESGGPSPKPIRNTGFGTTIIKDALASETSGSVDMDFGPGGLTVTMRAPMAAVLAT